MQHVFYPAIADRVGDKLKLEVPDLGISIPVPPDTDPYMLAMQAVGAHIEASRKKGRAPNPPSPLSAYRHRDAELIFQVPLLMHNEYVRVGINMHPALLTRVDQAAQLRGMSRTAFLQMAAQALVGDDLQAA